MAGLCAPFLLLTFFATTEVSASDWPQWRGPNRDGISTEVPLTLPEKKLLWEQPLPEISRDTSAKPSAGIVVSGGCAVAVSHNAGQDIVTCFNAETGKQLWKFSIHNPNEMQYGSGPRATPLISGGKVYALNASGQFWCLDLATGALVWEVNFPAQFKAKVPTWGFCTSPLIAGGKLIVSPLSPDAAIAALDPNTGKVLWQTKGSPSETKPPGQPHSSYIVGVFSGIEQIVGYDQAELAGWDLATGKKLWGLQPPNDGDFNVGTPLNVVGRVLAATDNNATRLYAFEKTGKMIEQPVARNDDLIPDKATPVFHQGLIFGSGNDFVCLDGESLKTRWLESRDNAVVGYTTVIAGNGRLLVLSEEGELSLLVASAQKFESLGHMTVCGRTWSHPAVADGRLFIRDAKAVYCYKLK
ncbi:MAG TPA: PQQ-binding-like beta-propeller repeat protein [Planctomycetota bacterium]